MKDRWFGFGSRKYGPLNRGLTGWLGAALVAAGCGGDADAGDGFGIGQGDGERYSDLADIPPAEGESLDFEVPELNADPDAPQPPPCSTCAELNMRVDDVNQRATFALTVEAAEGTALATQVVWTLIIPFNSDQLFIQPNAGGTSGNYTNLHINNFEPNTPVQFVQTLSRPVAVSRLAMSIGSSGAWTGDRTMQLFIDSVEIVSDDGASLVVDAELEGFNALGDNFEPQVQFHP